jgi:hypothetical protein
MADQLREWHDFFILIGTASATLVGLMFVAASVGASVFTSEREIGLRSFLTPTVLHFSIILLSCLVGIAPSLADASFGTFLATGGAVGIGYSCHVWLRMRRGGITQRIDLADRFCYIIIPLAIYLTLIATGIAVPRRPVLGLDMLAATLVALLLLGIRNAWDMTLWIVLNTPNR